MSNFFDTKIEYLKGIGPQNASLLNTELNIFTYEQLIQYYPFRYEDRSVFHKISEITEELPYIQLKGQIKTFSTAGIGRKQRLVATFKDDTGSIELVWFQGAKWIVKSLKTNVDLILYGKPALYGRKFNIAHPEIELASEAASSKGLQPVYNTTEKLKNKFLDSKALAKLQYKLVEVSFDNIQETLSPDLVQKFRLVSK